MTVALADVKASSALPLVHALLDDGSVLVGGWDASGAEHLGFVRPSVGPAFAEVDTRPGVPGTMSAAPVAAVIVGGKRCALSLDRTLRLGCEGSTAEDSGVEMDRSTLAAVTVADGTLHVYGKGAFGGYDAASRAANGVWKAEDRSESSISWATDAVEHNGGTVTCFITDAGTAALDVAFSSRALPPGVPVLPAKVRSSIPASSCRLLASADALHVFAGTTYASLPWSTLTEIRSFEGKAVASLPNANVDGPLARIGENTYVIHDDGKALRALPLSSGATLDLGDGGFEALRVTANGTLLGARGERGAPQTTLRFATRCLSR